MDDQAAVSAAKDTILKVAEHLRTKAAGEHADVEAAAAMVVESVLNFEHEVYLEGQARPVLRVQDKSGNWLKLEDGQMPRGAVESTLVDLAQCNGVTRPS